MKKSAITLLLLILVITGLQAKTKKPKKAFITFEEINRELYFTIDKTFMGAKVEVIDANGNAIKAQVLNSLNTMMSLDSLPKSSYTIRVRKDADVTEFYFNSMYCLNGLITLEKKLKVINLDFMIPYELEGEAVGKAIASVTQQLRMNIDLFQSKNKLADVSLDLISDHEFNLLIESDSYHYIGLELLQNNKKHTPAIAKSVSEKEMGDHY